MIRLKIEIISENQVKFTLSREDLASRHLRISELAYGSDKARELFSELMQRATEQGFEAEDLPLMIEAIPMPSESLILLVTKMEDPEELDSNFSNFTQGKGQAPAPSFPAADEIISCVKHLRDILHKYNEETKKHLNTEAPEKKEEAPETAVTEEELANIHQALARVYIFDNLSLIRKFAAAVIPFYKGSNSLYKDGRTGLYYLVLRMDTHSPEEFNRVCNMAAEYGDPANISYATMSYFDEHFTKILENSALEQLKKL